MEQTELPNGFVDEVDESIEQMIEESRAGTALTQRLDDRMKEIFLAPSKHARDIYNRLWMEALDTDYNREQKVDLGAVNQSHHNTSLVADDRMDGDEDRRGVPTFHTSDFLVSEFSREEVDALTLSQVIKYTTMPYSWITGSSIPGEDQAEHISILSDNVMDLVEGQNEDVTGSARLEISEDDAGIVYGDEYLDLEEFNYSMIDGKTGALFRASSETAGAASGYRGEELSEHALELGRLLQLTDDILDYHPGADKDYLSDLREGKPTIIVSYGLEELEGEERELLRRAVDSETGEEELYETADILEENGVIDRARETAEGHAEEAKRIVDEAYDSGPIEHREYADDLNRMADIVLNREGR
ncbi:MAG: polyprenyl synthetase family protein [Candidatus Nanohaloarchaea archaeon]